MKTKITLTLLAFTAISLNTIRAEEVLVDTDGDGFAETVVNLDQLDEASLKPTVKLCGGADDDQLTAGTKICGGADDDQIVGGDGVDFVKPVYQGLVSDPLGFFTNSAGAIPLQSPQMNGFTPVQLPSTLTSDTLGMTIAGGGWAMTSGGNGSNSIIGAGPGGAPHLTSDPLGITGNNAPRISGGSLDNVTDAMILQVMTTGRLTGDSMDDDDLWAGGGTDEKARTATGTTRIESDPFGLWIEFTLK